jgi:hypothetical protein
LFLGFSIRVNLHDNEAVIEWTPQAYVRESVLDYVQLRRERGASANAITKILTTYRNRVIVAPTGNYGSVVEFVMRKAGDQKVSDTDTRNLVEFWKQIYDIDISSDEIPLLKVKMVNSEATFTYPPIFSSSMDDYSTSRMLSLVPAYVRCHQHSAQKSAHVCC